MIKCAATVGTSEDITGGPTNANNLRFLLKDRKGATYPAPKV